MEISMKPGDLSQVDEMTDFVQMVTSRAHQARVLQVDLENTTHMNLGQYNNLIKLYVKLRRSGQKVVYKNIPSLLESLISKTNFQHVFSNQTK